MENITKIYLNENGTFHTTHYNGSWNVIKMETTDDLDYSMTIYEYLNEAVWNYEDEEGIELEGQEYDDFIKCELEFLADAYEIELVSVNEVESMTSKITYLVDGMMEMSDIIKWDNHFPHPASFHEAVKFYVSPKCLINGERKQDCEYLYEHHHTLFEDIYNEKMEEVVELFNEMKK